MPGLFPGIFFNMKKASRRRLTFSIITLILIGIIVFGAYKYFTNQPPKDEIRNAMEAISAARKVEANKYARKKFIASENALELAMKEWELQNKKFFISRDYTILRDLANQALFLGNEAWREASVEKDSVGINLKHQLGRIQSQIDEFEKNYKNLPLSAISFERFSKARMNYIEANNDFRKNQYYEAEKAAAQSEKTMTQMLKIAKEKLADFYNDYPKWKKNAQYARELSAKGQLVILVNKLESTAYVLKSGKTLAQFKVEFGSNWMGNKIAMGDNATPEGIYKVTQKKSGSKTKYYKALLLNYPNEEDKKRFDNLVKNGSIPKKSKIGGLIQIHGFGGKGVNWTEGCIAMENDDMDKVYNLVQINTPVIIIGSEQPISKYLK